MAKPAPRELTVLSIQPLSPNMHRFILEGGSLADFPANQASAYVKLVFENPDPDSDRPLMRSITVVTSDPEQKTLTVDIALHNRDNPEKQGPAGLWAASAKPGSHVLLSGPGDCKLVDLTADWFLLAGDLTALPAIRANLQQMPKTAKGHVVLEVPTIADSDALLIEKQDFPEGIELHWIINPNPGQQSDLLQRTVASLNWLPGRPYIWAAGELKSVLQLRNHLNQQMSAPRPVRYISSYWQLGLDDEQHKLEKKRQLAE
ncbi:siderophore-interacting protein [Pelagibaculum spongiae]|uniref:NADPH-dependent ferric siderophore reductase n=1 Tax=Pelagibaculum spongiae TaxID=2080658 RepID=A0A2V1GNK1_9GAMM|nr:siderophore-interacting protein [Pelagibaculum spongiae]PVZ63541.1 NADPH-dependent ferric siderophore reductase [Pelagibaculum spongiae]